MNPVRILPAGSDILAELATHLIRRHRQQLPDLSQVCVLLPSLQPASRLRRQLLEAARRAGHAGLLGPEITTLRRHIEHTQPWEQRVIGNEARRLILVEALLQHPALFNHGNPWTLADALLELFDQLTLQQTRLPASLDEFIQQLQRAYGGQAQALGREAQLVHTLWQAWQQQLEALGVSDLNTAHLLRLARHTSHRHYYLADPLELAPAEIQWLERQRQTGRAHVFCEGSPPTESTLNDLCAQQAGPAAKGHTAYARLLDHVFEPDEHPLAERARRFADEHPHSPARGRLAVLSAEHFGDEAQGIVLQVIHWHNQGLRNIGLVIEDRRLARRLHALLLRHGIALKDSSGWALSTTAAAAALENWLAAMEEDFAHQPLLDLLKSPFFTADEETLRAVYQLQRDIIQRENIGRDLDRYRRAIHSLQRRMDPQRPLDHSALLALLDHLEHAAAPLQRLRQRNRATAGDYLAALTQSLTELGLQRGLEQDPAGQELLRLLDDLAQASRHSTLHLDWLDFRAWLGRAMERHNFLPRDDQRHYVELVQLQQSSLLRFEALVIGSLDREHLPGRGDAGPFFNQAVRRELGLPTLQQQHALQLHRFRRLLLAAPRILLSWHRGEQGAPPSPWLERLQSFHRLGWGEDLEAGHLHHWLTTGPGQTFPAKPTQRPAPSLPASAFPRRLSASAHQQLIDCPYAFFAARGLGLEAIEEVRQAMRKNDYGQRVHRCLEAFHHSLPGLPPAFEQRVTSNNREQAIARLQAISTVVFRQDIEDNFAHRGWLKRWQKLIPDYIDWEIQRQQHWRFQRAEVLAEQEYRPGYRLYGRLDRIDRHLSDGGLGLVDYKTGTPPRLEQVLTGEQVQLLHYAASQPGIVTAQYLHVDNDPRRSPPPFDQDHLFTLTGQVIQRLVELSRQIEHGAGLPAWGDEQACRHCRFKGLCRRDIWQADTT